LLQNEILIGLLCSLQHSSPLIQLNLAESPVPYLRDEITSADDRHLRAKLNIAAVYCWKVFTQRKLWISVLVMRKWKIFEKEEE